MPSIKRESYYEKKYCARAGAEGWDCLKFSAPGRPGYPDRLLLRSLDFALVRFCDLTGSEPSAKLREQLAESLAESLRFVEFKVTGGKFQPRQKRIIKGLRSQGFCAKLMVDDRESEL